VDDDDDVAEHTSSFSHALSCAYFTLFYMIQHTRTCLHTNTHIQGDLHDRAASSISVGSNVLPYADPGPEYLSHPEVITYRLDIYPTQALVDSYRTFKPIIYTVLIGGIFFIMAVTFFMFNWYIQQRNRKVVMAAARSNAIVSTIFPSNIRERLYNDVNTGTNKKRSLATTSELKQFIRNTAKDDNGDEGDMDDDIISRSKPIADLFPEVSG
jgi:hypothetical protein